MTSTTKACLFGGALMTAGIAAHAQEFVIGDIENYNYFAAGPGAYVYSLSYNPYAYDGALSAASGPTAVSAFSPDGSASAALSAVEMVGEVDNPISNAFNLVDFAADFTVDVSGTATASWDVLNNTFISGQQFRVVNLDDGTTVFEFDTINGPFSGSVGVPLKAGTNYQLIVDLVQFADTPGANFFSLSIPTPGAAACSA